MYDIYILFLLLLTVKRDDDVLGIIFLKPGSSNKTETPVMLSCLSDRLDLICTEERNFNCIRRRWRMDHAGCPWGGAERPPLLCLVYCYIVIRLNNNPQTISPNLYEVLPIFKGTSDCYTSSNKCISAFLFFIRTFSIGSGHLKFFLL